MVKIRRELSAYTLKGWEDFSRYKKAFDQVLLSQDFSTQRGYVIEIEGSTPCHVLYGVRTPPRC